MTKIAKMVKTSKLVKIVKTNEVVWGAIWIAWNPEKKFWTPGIEIYPLVTSNGPSGYRKNVKMSVCFSILDHLDVAMLLTAKFLMFWGLEWLWKLKFRPQKIILAQNFVKNIFLTCFQFFGFPKISFLSFSNFVIFLIFMIFKILGSKTGRWVGG